MKILLITNKSPWPPRDGGSSATLQMIYGLKSMGVSVTVLSLNTVKHHVNIHEIPADLRSEIRLVSTDTGIKPLKLITNLLLSKEAYSLQRFESEEFKTILESILHNSFDIVQIEGLAMTYYLDTIRKAGNSKTVYRAHNIENHILKGLASNERNPLKKSYLRILAERTMVRELSVINSFDGIAAMTDDDLKWFISEGLEKPSAVIHPSSLISPVNDKVKEEIPYSVVYIGALDWRPNIHGLRWFIKNVWPKVIDSVPGANLHVAGRNPSEEVYRFCKGKGISFYGEVDSSKVFISDKSVMVVPLFAGSGIRMKIIEGMSCSKSIIATSSAAGGMKYNPGNDLVIADTPDDFAAALTTLLADKERRTILGRNAVENVRKNYNIFASTENLIKFYSQLT